MTHDPVVLEILNNQLTALTEEMCHTLQRTGRTLYVKETADFCCALAGADGRFFAYPRGIGVSGFVGLNCLTTLQAVGTLQPGDVILTNDPYRSRGLATHLPDLQVIAPYFHGDQIVAYGWAFLHASDVGGRVPSSISPTNSEIFQEGLQVPPVKLVRAGEINQDLLLLLSANSRTPQANQGDILALLAALGAGERRLAHIIARRGVAQVLAARQQLIDYSAARARQVLRRIPDGHYSFADYLDDEAGSGLPVRLAVTITLLDGRIHLDFSATDPQVAAAINIPGHGDAHAWLTLRILALVCTLDNSVPLNAGLLEPVTLFAPQGSLVNPVYPAAVGVRHAAAVRINDVLNGVLGQALPDVMPAASGGTIIPLVVAQAPDASGTQNVQVIEPMVGGGGARYGSDGIDGRDNSISNLSNNPVEMVEAETAVQIREYALRPDSGGAGQWRGGCGQQIRIRMLAPGSTLLARGMERLRFQPWGAQGGLPGAFSRLTWFQSGTAPRALGKIDLLPVNEGDEILLQTPGGGGWGDPYLRPAEAVARDVALGVVSAGAAAEDYGVVLVNGQPDPEATAARRGQPVVRSSRGLPRDSWDHLFDSATLDRLNALLFTLPTAQRQAARQALFAPVLAGLPADFPAALPADYPIDAIRQRWLDSIDALAADTSLAFKRPE